MSDFILTSNRDEAPDRATLAPKNYKMEGTQLIFPKDELAGGTWIGVSERNRLACLLNGGRKAHERKPSYRMSRGLLVTQFLTEKDAIKWLRKSDFDGIEPFTLVYLDWDDDLRLFEFVWSGKKSHFEELSLAPHIWSSSLLYTPEAKEKREVWFSDFLFDSSQPAAAELMEFHKTAGDGDTENDLIMDRGFVKTKSISQLTWKNERGTFYYEDLINGQATKLKW